MSIDYSAMTLSEIGQILTEASEAYRAREVSDALSDQQRRQRIAQAVDSLTALLGPADPQTPGLGSIREMRAYPPEMLQEHAGIAIAKLLEGLEILTATTRDLASVVGQ